MNKNKFLNIKINDLLEKYPFMEEYIQGNNTIYKDKENSILENINKITKDEEEEMAIDKEEATKAIYEYFLQLMEFLGIKEDDEVKSLTILSGYNKLKEQEKYDELTIKQGEIIGIVGPTGSGKSRLLADIEWIADRDTPTNRKILINGKEADKKWRFSSGNKLVAQLSQNMNFVMDLTVKEFLELHAESRLVEDVDAIVAKILGEANKLAGEKFDVTTAITSLSGGQSRALMIADTAILSKSPIVLIDEIENAGIDRKKALKLLVKEEKIVLMATHDPILALMANKRIVISNGGISKVIETSDNEKKILGELEELDKYIMKKRQSIRMGESL